MGRYEVAHKVAENLSGRLILSPARVHKLLAQFALNPDSETHVFHAARVYPMDTHQGSIFYVFPGPPSPDF